MANRSYLYSLDVFPNYLKPRAIGLSESEYNIPLIYRILVSSAPQATESILFSGQEKIAITADYDGGVRKLEEFFSKLPQEYKEKADNVIKFLKDYKNRQLYIHLECAEIFEMEAESDDELEKKNAELVEEIKNIDEEIKKALKRIHYDGDTFDVRELEAEYWTNTLYFMPDSEDNAREDEETKPNAKLEPEQAHNEVKTDDIESYLAEPEYHQYSYGGGFFALIIKEGEKVALPLEPEKMFEEREYRLFVLSKDDEKLGEIEYHRALELIRKFAYFETLDKVDGFECLFFQNPPEKEFLHKILAEAQKENIADEVSAPPAPQNPRITRTLVKGVRPAYFETVHVEGDENNPAGIEMARTVLTRAQSDAAMDFVFSESTQIDTDEDDEVFPIDSFSFYWAIQYCNALSITCALEPCYSIDGETNPRKWLYAPYSEYNSYTEKVNSDYENSDYYARLVFNPNANGWRLPTLDECKRAAKTDGIQKDTIAELGLLLWVWRDDIPSHSAIISSDWNKEDLTAPFASPEVATPQYSIRICRNGGTVLPETVYYDWRKAKEEAEEYEEESDFDKAERERLVEEFWQAHKERQRQEQAEKEEQTSWFHILAPIVIIILGLFFFTITNSITVFYAVAVLLYLTHDDKKQPKVDSQKPRADSKKRQQTVSYEAQTESNEEETPDYAGWWNYKPNGLNDFQQAEPVSQQPEADSQDKNDEGGKYTHEQAKWILQRIHDTDGAETIRIKTAVKDTPLPLTASKFGGLPYWERTDEFPRDEDGKPLYLLAQINFAEVPPLPDYPTSGLLQIFVQADDTWGLDFKDEKQKNWRIVYHKFFSSSLAMSEAELRAMGVKTAADVDEESGEEPLPFTKEYALSFEKQLTFVHPNLDDQFDDTVQAIAEELGFPVFDGGALDWFEEDDYNAFYLENKEAQHQIGGFPNFTQGDVRRVGDVLLFQMDSELGKGENGKGDDWEILWGDCGIANFFISRADLKNLDFSNVLYNWDCY